MRLAIYHPRAEFGLRASIFGAAVANLGLYQALAQHGGFTHIDVLGGGGTEAPELGGPTRVEAGSIFDEGRLAAAGALLRGNPDIADLAWLRRDPGAYSLLGLVHTLGPPVIRERITATALAPTFDWDALVCTSPAVRQALEAMFDAQAEHLAARLGASRSPRPQLPLIPLGVDLAAFQDRPQARARIRAEYGLGDDQVLALWVGRLSFFEKAFPQPMLKAAQEARVTAFTFAGWFPDEPRDRPLYEAAARAYAPGVAVRFEDGRNAERLADLWAAADVFVSLVDNIQETFGITPLEAMAAGLPVVASDWDGYRYTIEDGVQGFLIPTLGGPASGVGAQMAAPHMLSLVSYETYAGTFAQHTAVHVGRAAEALRRLCASPELRRTMGAAGRARVAAAFDWPVIARQYAELIGELAQVRAAAGAQPRQRLHHSKGDPFAEFAHFATAVLTPQTPLAVRGEGALTGVELDGAFPGYRASPAECEQVLEAIRSGRARTVGEVAALFPAARRAQITLGIAWMAKLGVLDWLE